MDTMIMETEKPVNPMLKPGIWQKEGEEPQYARTGRRPDPPFKHQIKRPGNSSGQFNWIWMGIVVSLVFSLIFIACYELFESRAAVYTENYTEEDDNLSWLYENNQVLYRDLYNLLNNTDLGYTDLYYPLSEEMKNYDPDSYYEEAVDESTGEYSDSSETVVVNDEKTQEYYQVRAALESVTSYFEELEHRFSELNANYDYMILDTKSGDIITNTALKERLNPDDYYFYLSFVYDGYGNVRVGENVKGEDADKVRKNANEITRSLGVGSDSRLKNYGYLDVIEKNSTRVTPVNCEIIYGISNAAWTQSQNAALNDSNSITYRDQIYAFQDAGCITYYLFFLLAVCAVAVFLPLAGKGSPWKTLKICRLPLEGLGAIGIVLITLSEKVVNLAVLVTSGRLYHFLFRILGDDDAANVLIYGFNIVVLSALFFGAWYIGTSLRGVREEGILNYIKTRSLIYRFFPFIKSRCLAVYDALIHFDVTRNAKKLIVKIVLMNAVVLFIISSLWFGGFAITVIYSVLLYFVLKKYVSDLQKKYSILLSATNEIAQGNLNVCIPEDLGVFEPFKPQIIRIQRGFRNAVEEELKSQRMKAELITNVSHDLKTPLTAIITYIGLLKDESITPKQRQEYMNILEMKSRRLKVLIEDLFEVSKATSKNVTLNIMDVDIMNLLKQVAFEMSDKLSESHLDVRMNLTEQKVILPLDSQKTYRIYENLFGNIAKYALPGTRVYVNGFVIDDMVVITLKNITAQEITVTPEELTDRFVRGDSSRNTEGSGLGLAIAKSFTELQNGRLTVEMDGDLFKVTTAWRLVQSNSDSLIDYESINQ